MNQLDLNSNTEAIASPIIPSPAPAPTRTLMTIELDIIRFAVEMRYLNVKQIKRKFGKRAQESSIGLNLTLRTLINENHLKCKDKDFSDLSLIQPTQSGYEEVVKQTVNERPPKFSRNIFAPRVKHDLLLNDLRIQFEEWGFLTRWVPEMTMEEIPFFKRQFDNLPDALCKKKNNKAYFLELEVSPKNPGFYRERVQQYMKVLKTSEVVNAGIEGVMFICTKEEVMEMIWKQIPDDCRNITAVLYERYLKLDQEMGK